MNKEILICQFRQQRQLSWDNSGKARRIMWPSSTFRAARSAFTLEQINLQMTSCLMLFQAKVIMVTHMCKIGLCVGLKLRISKSTVSQRCPMRFMLGEKCKPLIHERDVAVNKTVLCWNYKCVKIIDLLKDRCAYYTLEEMIGCSISVTNLCCEDCTPMMFRMIDDVPAILDPK